MNKNILINIKQKKFYSVTLDLKYLLFIVIL